MMSSFNFKWKSCILLILCIHCTKNCHQVLYLTVGPLMLIYSVPEKYELSVYVAIILAPV